MAHFSQLGLILLSQNIKQNVVLQKTGWDVFAIVGATASQ